MKNVLQRASQLAIQRGTSGSAADFLAALQKMPQKALGDPRAAAKMGEQVSRSAGAAQQAEAKTAAEIANGAQRTYRKLAEKAATEEERRRILDVAARSEERALESMGLRVQAIERTTQDGYGTVKAIALGAAGLAIAGAVYMAVRSKK